VLFLILVPIMLKGFQPERLSTDSYVQTQWY